MTSTTDCLGAACNTVLLDDSPTSEDSFRHSAIAEAMAQLILDEKGGRAIALTGAWGSGKSTVVRLLGEKLQESGRQVRLVTFDAWAHQGDPLRRTFIEQAMSALNDWRPTQNAWEKRLDILSRRWSETVTHARPQLSVLGGIGAIALLVSPAANQLYGVYSKVELKTPSYLTWILFALGALPLLVAAGIVLYWFIQKGRGIDTPLPSLIYSSSENRTTTSTSKTPEPTSIEFAEAYRELLRDAVGGMDRRVVFVIDNLDRINDDEAKAIWGTLKAFFDTPLHSEHWYSKVWVIVPFDEGAVAQLWEQGSTNIASHFIEKTFQAFFRVPSTLLSSWETYFYEQFKVAFPSHSDAHEQLTIFRLFDALRSNQETPPTPRQIKLLLNTVGGVHRQWRGVIPLVTQAAFTLALARSNNFVAGLQNADQSVLMPYDIGSRLPEHWQRDMAALYFNVPLDVAFEALLGYPVVNCLRRGDGTALAELENSPGFDQVIRDTFERQYTRPIELEQETVKNTALALSSLVRPTTRYIACWKILYTQATHVTRWDSPDINYCLMVEATLAANISLSARPIVDSLLASVYADNGKLLEDDALQRWSASANRLLPMLAQRDEAYLRQHFAINTNPKGFINVIGALLDEGADSIVSLVSFRGAKKDLVDYLANEAPDWSLRHHRILVALATHQSGWEWEAVLDAGATQIGAAAIAGMLPALVETVFYLVSSYEWDLDLLRPLESENAMAALQSLTPDSEAIYKLASLLLASKASLVQVLPKQQQSPHYYNQMITGSLPASTVSANSARVAILDMSDRKQVAFRKLKNAAMSLWDLVTWRAVSIALPDRAKFVSALAISEPISTLTENQLTSRDLVEQREYWREALGAERFMQEITGTALRGSLSRSILDLPYDMTMDSIYLVALRNDDSEALRRVIQISLKQVQADVWKDEFSGDSDKLDLAAEAGIEYLGLPLSRALIDHANQELENPNACSVSRNYEALVSSLIEGEQEHFLSEFANAFASGSAPYENCLPCLGSMLARALGQEGPDRARARILQTVHRAAPSEINWLATLIREWDTKDPKCQQVRKLLKAEFQALDIHKLSSAQASAIKRFYSTVGWKN